LVLQRGLSTVYDLEAQRSAQATVAAPFGGQPFLPDIYPPLFILARAWLAALPIGLAYAAWLLLNATVLFAALVLLTEAAGLRGRRRAAALLAGAGSAPAVIDLWQGQAAGFVLLGIGLAAWLLTRRRFTAGAALTITLVKPHTVVALVALPFTRGWWRTALALAISTVLVAAVSIALIGPGASVHYLQLVGGYAGSTDSADAVQRYTLTVRAPLAAAGMPGWAQLAVLGLLLLAVLAATDLVAGPPLRDVAAATTASLVMAPHLNSHDLVLLAAPGILLASRLWDTGDRLGWAILACVAASATIAPYFPWPAPLAELALLAYLLLRWSPGRVAQPRPSEAPSRSA
jgi:hypothetical protein